MGRPVGARWQAACMSAYDPKADLHRYLRVAREALLWKLDGVSEYDVRRPLTPSGTNLLGLTKHLAGVTVGYFGWTFGRPVPAEITQRVQSWYPDGDKSNTDMWASAEESRELIVDVYRQGAEIADATITELPLDAEGQVPWWPAERNPVTLQLILLHMVAETNRHAGHADIVREQIDGAIGLRADNSNLPDDGMDWPAYRARLEEVAARFR